MIKIFVGYSGWLIGALFFIVGVTAGMDGEFSGVRALVWTLIGLAAFIGGTVSFLRHSKT